MSALTKKTQTNISSVMNKEMNVTQNNEFMTNKISSPTNNLLNLLEIIGEQKQTGDWMYFLNITSPGTCIQSMSNLSKNFEFFSKCSIS